MLIQLEGRGWGPGEARISKKLDLDSHQVGLEVVHTHLVERLPARNRGEKHSFFMYLPLRRPETVGGFLSRT